MNNLDICIVSVDSGGGGASTTNPTSLNCTWCNQACNIVQFTMAMPNSYMSVLISTYLPMWQTMLLYIIVYLSLRWCETGWSVQSWAEKLSAKQNNRESYICHNLPWRRPACRPCSRPWYCTPAWSSMHQRRAPASGAWQHPCAGTLPPGRRCPAALRTVGMSQPRAGNNRVQTPAPPPSAGRPGGGKRGRGVAGGGTTRCGWKVKHPIYVGRKGNVFSWVPDVCMCICKMVVRKVLWCSSKAPKLYTSCSVTEKHLG